MASKADADKNIPPEINLNPNRACRAKTIKHALLCGLHSITCRPSIEYRFTERLSLGYLVNMTSPLFPPERMNMDTAWLASLGYERLTEAQALVVLRRAMNALDLVVGSHLTMYMSASELQSFGPLLERHNDTGMMHWIQTHVSDYQAVVNVCFHQLEDTLRATARKFADEENKGKNVLYGTSAANTSHTTNEGSQA